MVTIVLRSPHFTQAGTMWTAQDGMRCIPMSMGGAWAIPSWRRHRARYGAHGRPTGDGAKKGHFFFVIPGRNWASMTDRNFSTPNLIIFDCAMPSRLPRAIPSFADSSLLQSFGQAAILSIFPRFTGKSGHYPMTLQRRGI